MRAVSIGAATALAVLLSLHASAGRAQSPPPQDVRAGYAAGPSAEAAAMTASHQVKRVGDELTIWLADGRGLVFKNWHVLEGFRQGRAYTYMRGGGAYHFLNVDIDDRPLPAVLLIAAPSGLTRTYYMGEEAAYVSPGGARVVSTRDKTATSKAPLVEILGLQTGTPVSELSCQAREGAGFSARLLDIGDERIAVEIAAASGPPGAVTFRRTGEHWQAEKAVPAGVQCQ